MKTVTRGVLILALLGLPGCTTNSASRANARAAYNAGRAAAYREAMEQQRTSIRIIGNVHNSELAWKDGMSLMEALAESEWAGQRDPREIRLISKSDPTPVPVDMKALLGGDDILLQPGDTIELR
jgi:hypothetical protein